MSKRRNPRRAQTVREKSAQDSHLFAAFLQKFNNFDPFIWSTAISSLVLRILIPANVYTNTAHDDFLGIQIAQHLLNGDWFGPWDNRTLLKPPGYSFFLLISHFTGIEPQILLHVIYLFTVVYFVWIIKQVFEVNIFSVAVRRLSFALLAFNPMLFSGDFSRIYRMSLNVVLAFLFVLVVIHLWLLIFGKSALEPKFLRKVQLFRNQQYVFLSISIGLLYSGLVLTRSEAIWLLYPSIVVLLSYAIIVFFKTDKDFRRSKLSLAAVIFVSAVVSYNLPIQGIKAANQHYYGVSQIENYYSGEFSRAFSLWTGVEGSKKSESFIPINQSQREAVYAISSTARNLRPLLETPPNTGWKIPNCQQSSICDESGPWFPFELRDAVSQTYSVNSEVEFQKVFNRIANDIESACTSKKISCGRAGSSTGTLNFLDMSKRQLANDLAIYLQSLQRMDQALDNRRNDGGSDISQLEQWDSVVKINRILMSNDNELYLVLGDWVSLLRDTYSKFYVVLLFVMVFTLFVPRKKFDELSQIRLIIWFLLGTILLYGGGMGIFHSATNLSANNSFYTQPAAPIFLLMLVLSLNLAVTDFKNFKGVERSKE